MVVFYDHGANGARVAEVNIQAEREERLAREITGCVRAVEERDIPTYSCSPYPNCDLPLLEILALLYSLNFRLSIPNPKFVLRVRIDANVGLGNRFGGRHSG